MSKHHEDDNYTITDNLDFPDNYVYPEEIRLIATHFGDLLLDVISKSEE